MNWIILGFPVLHYLPELTQTHVHWISDAIQPAVIPFSSCPQSFPVSGSFPVSQLFPSGDQSIEASAPVLPMNIQGWLPLGLTGLISLLIFMANSWRNNGKRDRLCFLGLQNHCRWWLQTWNEKTLAPWKKSYDRRREQRHHLTDRGPSSQG